MKECLPIYFGEFLGTFLLVFIGISAVAAASLFGAFSGTLEVGIVWGAAVTLAIYATRHLSCAHLNPAVSLGMVLAGRMRTRLLLPYWICQLSGAFAAGMLTLAVFNPSIQGFEAANGIVRGAPASVRSAMLFGEYFPNPAFALPWFEVDLSHAMLAEGLGTFLLVVMIFLLTEGCNVGRPGEGASPIFIGGTVATLIAILAPLTQMGINPARDLGPRIVAFLAGWDKIAIPGPKNGFLTAYVLAPLMGGALAAFFFRWVLAPLMQSKNLQPFICSCKSPNLKQTSP